MLPLGLPTCRSDRVCKGRRVKGRCPRKGHSYFLNENRAFSAVNTALFARPKVYRKTNGFLNATAGYISGENFSPFLSGNRRGRHSREMALSYRKTVFASACGRSTFPAHRRKRKKAVLSRTFNSLFLLLFAVKCLT